MSTRSAHEEIRRFLQSAKPEVLCVTGKWGVGKTYSWKHYLKEAQSLKAVALNRYSYVSLFGQNSLDDLRYAIFENTIPIENIDGGPNAKSLKSVRGTAETFLRSQMWLAGIIPQGREFLEGAGRALFFVVRNQIVCIDDLERAGAGLDAKDVLGMISFLKEERKCKVVLLLNDEQLSQSAQTDFRSQLEKVADTRVVFDPTPSEAAEIGVSREPSFHELLIANCISLGITNIRVIKKIERAGEALAQRLNTFDPGVLKQAIHTLTLFGWAHFQPSLAPPLEFLRRHNPWQHLSSKKEVSEDEKRWEALLQAYGFMNVDELDKAVLQGIERGYFDTDALEKSAVALQKEIEHNRRDNSFSKAWDLYHYSWEPAEKVLDEMYGLLPVSWTPS